MALAGVGAELGTDSVGMPTDRVFAARRVRASPCILAPEVPMPFTVEDFHDLLHLLEQHPEWRSELRRHLLPDELLELPVLVRQLAEGQERLTEAQAATQAQLQKLTEAQARTDERLERLTEAQARTEERLQELAKGLADTQSQVRELAAEVRDLAAQVRALTEAQTRAELRLERLEEEQGRMRRHLGSLTELVGARAEVDAERTLVDVLRGKDYQLLSRPRPIGVDGEVDRAVQVVRDGQVYWVLLEAKARLHRADVAGWDRRLRRQDFLARLRRASVEPPLLPYAFGLTVYEDAEQAGAATGIGILDAFGERLEAAPR